MLQRLGSFAFVALFAGFHAAAAAGCGSASISNIDPATEEPADGAPGAGEDADGAASPNVDGADARDPSTLDGGDAAATCPGVDLTTSSTNCGLCGHDCNGSKCISGACAAVEVTSFATPAPALMIASGKDAGRLVMVVREQFNDAAPLTILTVDPASAPGTAPTVVSSGLFPGKATFQSVSIADGSVYIVRTSRRADDAAPCTVSNESHLYCSRASRVSLSDGSVDTWFARSVSGPDSLGSFYAGSGDRLLLFTSTNIIEYTKSAVGPSGRSVGGFAGHHGLRMEGSFAYALDRSSLSRIDLVTFKSTPLFKVAGATGSTFLGRVGSKLYMTFTDSKNASLHAFDTVQPGAMPVTLKSLPFKGYTSPGDVGEAHAVFHGSYGGLDVAAVDFATGATFPLEFFPAAGEFVVLGRWVYALQRGDSARANKLYRVTL